MCPQSMKLYNQFMGGVDHNDQLRGYYNVRLKCKKFYTYIFWFLFDVAVTNSYILFIHFNANPQTRVPDLKTYRVELVKSLIADYCSRKRRGRPSLCTHQTFLSSALSCKESREGKEDATTATTTITMVLQGLRSLSLPQWKRKRLFFPLPYSSCGKREC